MLKTIMTLLISSAVALCNPIVGEPVPLNYMANKEIVTEAQGHFFIDEVGDYMVGYLIKEGVLISIIYVKKDGKTFTNVPEMKSLLHIHSKRWGVTNNVIGRGVLISTEGHYAELSPNGLCLVISKITYANEFRNRTVKQN